MTTETTLDLGPAATGPDARAPTAIQKYDTTAKALGVNLAELVEFCDKAGGSGLLPRAVDTLDKAVVIALKGHELGLPPMQAFSQIHVINGAPTLSAQLMLGLAYKRLPEFNLKLVESNAKVCTMELRRDGRRDPVRVTWTIEEATAAGLTSKDNWKRHPRQMLQWRCTSEGLKLVAPDVFSGLYLPDEAEEIVQGEALVIDAPFVPEVVVPDEPGDVTPPDPIDAMTRDEIVAAIKDGGLAGEITKARAALKIPVDDKSVEAFRKLYRHVMAQIP